MSRCVMELLPLVACILFHCLDTSSAKRLPLLYEQFFECGGLRDRCVDSSLCRPVVKLMQGSDDDVSLAQFTYCGQRLDKWVDKESKFGYGPVSNARGPPMSCCDVRDTMKYPDINKICSSTVPGMRVERCGLTPMFYLSEDVKYALKHEYDYRFKQTVSAEFPCVDNSKNFWRVPRQRRCADKEDPKVAQNQPRSKTTRSVPKRQKRFVGGFLARMGQFPYLAVIYHKDYTSSQKYFGCLATIVHQRLLLTTKECVNKAFIDEIWAGAYQYRNDSEPGIMTQEVNDVIYTMNALPQRRFFEFAINFKITASSDRNTANAYNGSYYDPFGISFIRVDEPFQFNDFVQPVCLPLVNYRYDYSTFGESKISVGYGFQSASNMKGMLHYGHLRKARNCYNMLNEYFGKKFPMRDGRGDTIWDCLEPTEGVQPCSLDDGGPLLRINQKEGFIMQTAVLMPTPQFACGHPNVPLLYLDLYRFIRWFPTVFAKALEMKKPSSDRERIIDPQKLPSYNSSYPGHCLTEFEKKLLEEESNY